MRHHIQGTNDQKKCCNGHLFERQCLYRAGEGVHSVKGWLVGGSGWATVTMV
eukprot:m.65389 g.65389  ORF g.65389 m.65389 type:complete len:52 (+) comp23554_c0_seq1:3657-3812(+)